MRPAQALDGAVQQFAALHGQKCRQPALLNGSFRLRAGAAVADAISLILAQLLKYPQLILHSLAGAGQGGVPEQGEHLRLLMYVFQAVQIPLTGVPGQAAPREAGDAADRVAMGVKQRNVHASHLTRMRFPDS